MSLKRKASFPTMASPARNQSAIAHPPMLDDSPKHLHCRTRKRVRNDRPDDQTIYENTLRWLYTAQQRLNQLPTPPADSTEGEEDMVPDQEQHPSPNLDPRQQTLLKFFRPVHSSAPSCAPPSHINTVSSDPSRNDMVFLRVRDVGAVSPLTDSSSNSENMTLAPRMADHMDTDMDMDMDSGSDESVQEPKQWPGGFRWM